MYEGCHSDVLVCLSSPPPLNCRQRTLGRLPEVWGRWNRGVNLNLGPITLLSDFPHEVGHILSLVVYLFVCLRLCRLPFHWVHLFLSCSHVTGSLLNSLSISFWGARAHNYYFVHTCIVYIHLYCSVCRKWQIEDVRALRRLQWETRTSVSTLSDWATPNCFNLPLWVVWIIDHSPNIWDPFGPIWTISNKD